MEKARRPLHAKMRRHISLIELQNGYPQYGRQRRCRAEGQFRTATATGERAALPAKQKFTPKTGKVESRPFATGAKERLWALILALTGCLRLLLASDRGLLISLSLANLCNNTSSSTLLLKSSESTFQRFVVFDSNFSHLFPSHPPLGRGMSKSHYIKNIIQIQPRSVKSNFKKRMKLPANFLLPKRLQPTPCRPKIVKNPAIHVELQDFWSC